jgi:hypothetical protein
MGHELRDADLERRLHVLRLARSEQAEVEALEPVEPAHGRAQVERVASERDALDGRFALGHRHLRGRHRRIRRVEAQHAGTRRIAVRKRVEIALPCLDLRHLVLVADDPPPARMPRGEVFLRGDVDGEFVPHALAGDGVGVRGLFGHDERGPHEFRDVPRSADAGREDDLVLRRLSAQHVPIEADVGVAPRTRLPLRNARVVEGAPVRMPRQVLVEARAVDGRFGLAPPTHDKDVQGGVLIPAARGPIGDVARIGRRREPVDRGAIELLRIDEHRLAPREPVAHAQRRVRFARKPPKVEHLARLELERGDGDRRQRQLPDPLEHRIAAGDRGERRARARILVAEERLRLGLRSILEGPERIRYRDAMDQLDGVLCERRARRERGDRHNEAQRPPHVVANCSAASRA